MGSFRVELPKGVDVSPGPVTLTIRPEHIQIGVDEGLNTSVGLMRECIYVGTHTRCKIELDGHDIEATSPTDSPLALGEGGEVRVRLPPHRLWLLPEA
jgi:ABC-type sugar transport system ATPase subunit